MRFTAEHYDQAIQALQDGKTQLEPNGACCHICGDGGHQAWECGFNPLRAMALCAGIARDSEALHESLHYLAGYEVHFGHLVGPRGVVAPEVPTS